MLTSRLGRTLPPMVASMPSYRAIGLVRAASRFEAFDANLDADELQAARKWRKSFVQGVLPQGNTTFSRSSGPGGQHVNKTESKASTSWDFGELADIVPKVLHAKIRMSRYYAKKTDSITMQAQTQRSRSANADDNRQKLFEELLRIYDETVPGEASPENVKKYRKVEKAFHENRVREKRKHSSKKQFRKGGVD